MTNPLRTMDAMRDQWADTQVQDAMAVLADHWNRQWEQGRSEREKRIWQRIKDWRAYEEGCDRRGAEYARHAAEYPHAHRLHGYHLRCANDQFEKAAYARRQIKALEDQL